MLYRKILITAVAVVFIFGCDMLKHKHEHETTGAVHAHDDHLEHDHHEHIVLKPEAIEIAGIKTEEVILRPLKIKHTFPGKVSLNETRLAHVGPRISGRAIEIYANLGDDVKKGHALAMIDSIEIGEAQSQYLKAKTTFEIAEKSYARAKILLEGKVISTGEFQRREGEYFLAKTELKVAEDRLHLLGMTEEEIASIGNRHTISSKVAIHSPLSGTVIERHLTLGEVVEPVKPIFTISDLSSLWVIADIPEGDISKIKKGQGVAVTVSPYPEKVFRGKLSYISKIIDPETRAAKVRAEVKNLAGVLKPEMFATVKITSSEKKNVLAVPESAVQRVGDKTIVFVATPSIAKEEDEEVFEKRVVEIGPELGGFHQVISGIKKGERIVVKGAFILKSESLKELMEAHPHPHPH